MVVQKTELDRLAVVMMVTMCVVLGVQNVVVKIGNSGISPLWQSGLRSTGAAILLFAWAAWRGLPLLKRDGTLWPGIVSGVLFAGEFAMIYMALRYTDASRGVIFLYTAPFFVALGARWWLPQETMRWPQWAGMALAFSGVLLLFGENLLKGSGDAWIGDLMMVVGALFWASTTLVVKATALARVAPEKTLLYQLSVSAPVLLGLSLLAGEAGVFAPSAGVWAALAYQTVIVATIGYLAWFWLIRRYPTTRISSFSFLTPVMGVLAGVVLLDEPLTPAIMSAIALVGVGIWLANRPVPVRDAG